MNIKDILKRDEYKFLNNDSIISDSADNKLMSSQIILLTFGGSYSYGTNHENSDIDIRGIYVPTASEIILGNRFNICKMDEQYIHSETDTTLYTLHKFASLAANCNPNVLEILGCKCEHYDIRNQIAYTLLDNREMFISKRAKNTFGGYAYSQLNRLYNKLASDDRRTEKEKALNIKKSVDNAIAAFGSRMSGYNPDTDNINIYMDETNPDDINLYANIKIDRIPLSEFGTISSNIYNIVNNFNQLLHRNRKKDEYHINKHSMHLIRLYLMAIDIFEKGDIITYRENDLPLLKDILNGKYLNDDGRYNSAFFDMVNDFEKRFNYAYENTSIPDEPDYNRIEDILYEIYTSEVLKNVRKFNE